MPFKLKLKKTRQYNVASKSLFVISVELLDGGVADCTLSVDSTGQECLDNVCQRQAINQPEFFGLRYINTNQQPRWVQLERPLKRQLEKYASSHQLYLRVMYYVVSGTSLITDEVTRYHYFLQLKNDLVEGRIICDCQQAVVLASYSRQTEYGNYDRERHTVEYMKNLLTFPKQMIDGGQIIESSSLAESGKLERLTSAVLQHYMTLQNISQAQAEEGFITACQQLRGYGQELFVAKDHKQNEVTISISLSGITVVSDSGDMSHFYRWMDIANVINHKRSFSIECTSRDTATFTLREPELGKYVWRLCVLQHTFYMRHQSAPPRQQTVFQDHLSESREELSSCGRAALPAPPTPLAPPAPLASQTSLVPLSAAHRAHSTSCLELPPQAQPLHRRALLPSYRPAPDYETAIQQKYQQQRAEAQMRFQSHHTHGPVLASKPLVYGSHPDIHRVHYPDVTRNTVSINQDVTATDDYAYGLKYLGHNNYTPFAVNPNVQTDINSQLHYVNVYKPPPPYPSNGLASNSTPDLAVASQALNYHRGYINSHVSGSSPDLVSTRSALNQRYLGYINGNVTSMMNYGRPVMASTHGTYNNLTSVLDANPHIIMDPHHISDNIQKVYDERGNIMYSMPMHRVSYQRHVMLPQTQQIPKLSDTQEPIYENVPLPWQNEGRTMRDRAQSLTSTDEIARLNERNSSHPSINNHGNLTNITVPTYMAPPIKIESDNHYVNAQIIKGVRESSVPKDLNTSNRSINKDAEFENITLSVDRVSMRDEKDETPYQSLSTHKVNNNYEKNDNVTSIIVSDAKNQTISSDYHTSISQTSTVDGAFTNSTMNSSYSTVELDSTNTTKNSNVSSKEKKRRRWGVFMGRAAKTVDVKSATLGRDREKNAVQPANKHRWSTGLPKFQPLPPSISKETLCTLLERKMSDNQLAFAFEQIPKGREVGAEMTTALLPENAYLNGYSTEHLPYEDNRVKLPPTPNNKHGYINASHITMTVGSSQRFYVLAKTSTSPRPPRVTLTSPGVGSMGSMGGVGSMGGAGSVAGVVWECAWAVGARVVARVGEAMLPKDGSTEACGKLQITVSESRGADAAWGATRRVRLRCGAAARDLWHLAYTADLTADVNLFLSFLSELNALRLSSAVAASAQRSLGAHNAPLLLTSENGSAGLVLAADLLLHILDNNQELDIPRTISLLHQQRANIIQNVNQYKFLHQVLLQYLKQSRLI